MIHLNKLSKVYKIHQKAPGLLGSVQSLVWRRWIERHAVRALSIDLAAGQRVGLLGANGAGKTTLIKLLAGIVRPTSGHLEVFGFRPWERKNEYRRQIALIMGQKAQLWWDLPASDCFLLLREIYQVPKDQFDDRLDYLSTTLRVQDLLTTPIRRLSLGERMKMELIAALLHQPKVIFLDEPTVGLDFTSQRALRTFLLEYHAQFKPTMILASHYMADIQSLCDTILLLREGELVFAGELDELIRQYATHKRVSVRLTLADADDRFDIESASDLAPLLSDAALSGVELTRDRLLMQVPCDRVPEMITRILQTLPVADLTIEEADVSTIIAALQSDVEL